MNNKIWARLSGSTVAELLTIDAELIPGKDIPQFWLYDVTVVPGISVGWVKTGDAFVAPPPPVMSVDALIDYSARARDKIATAGITVSGVKVSTDSVSQSIITGAYCSTLIDPTYSTPWKAADGTWTTLTAAQIVAIATAVSNHVKACFAAEQTCDAAIRAVPPTISTTAEIDTAFAAVTV